MANNLNGNPWVIDTPSGSPIYTRYVTPWLIRWVSLTAAAGHQVIIQDGDGDVKWTSVANGANYVEADHIESKDSWNGLIVPTLASGTLYIYVH